MNQTFLNSVSTLHHGHNNAATRDNLAESSIGTAYEGEDELHRSIVEEAVISTANRAVKSDDSLFDANQESREMNATQDQFNNTHQIATSDYN